MALGQGSIVSCTLWLLIRTWNAAEFWYVKSRAGATGPRQNMPYDFTLFDFLNLIHTGFCAVPGWRFLKMSLDGWNLLNLLKLFILLPWKTSKKSSLTFLDPAILIVCLKSLQQSIALYFIVLYLDTSTIVILEWRSIIPIWSSVASNLVSRLVVSVRRTMESVWFATRMCARVLWFVYVTSATTGRIKVDASFVVVPVFQMLTTVKNVLSRRKIVMGARKLSTWGALRQICSMRGRSTVSRNANQSFH